VLGQLDKVIPALLMEYAYHRLSAGLACAIGQDDQSRWSPWQSTDDALAANVYACMGLWPFSE
jgi:hypothetical protein